MFYFYSIIIVLYNLFLYAIFRHGIYDYLRLSKMSKNSIKKSTKGFVNYWFYQSVNSQKPLGILYSLNYIFLTATVVFTLLSISMGYIKALQPILFVVSILLCLIEIPSIIFASVYTNKMEYGKAFIFITKRKHTSGYYSSFTDMFSWCLTALLIYLSYEVL